MSSGGKREGSGRPSMPASAKPRAVRLSTSHAAKFKQLGGVRWLRQVLDMTNTEVNQ